MDAYLDEKELRIVLVGRTGSGKSSVGNSILGNKTFPVSLSGSSVTSQCKYAIGDYLGRPISIVDTPGLFDTLKPNKETLREVSKFLLLSTPGPHIIAIVIKVGITEEVEECLRLLMKTFGRTMKRHVVLIFTGKDDLEHDGLNLEKFIKTCSKELKKLTRDCNTCIAFNNRAQGEEMQIQIDELFAVFDSVLKKNSGRYFSNEMYDKLRKELNNEVKRMGEKSPDEDQRHILARLRNMIAENKEEILAFLTVSVKLVGAILLFLV